MSDRRSLTDHNQMLDAQNQCVPCKLCGGKAIITDAGTGAGYYIGCENGRKFHKSEGCLITERRLGGWAYNVMDWWNRLHATPALSTPTTPDEGLSPSDERDLADMVAAWRSSLANPASWMNRLRALLAPSTEVQSAAPAFHETGGSWNVEEAIYVRFSEDGQHIRKWSRQPFDGGVVFRSSEGEGLREALDERIANYEGLRDAAVDAGVDENGYALAVEALERVRHDISALKGER